MGRVRWLPLICMMVALMVSGNTHASETEGFAEIKQGDKGNQVKEVQELLSKLVYMPSAIDGDFGVKTEQAVEDFQKSVGSETNGIVDQATYDKLKEDRGPVEYTLTANLWVRDLPSIIGTEIGKLDVFQTVKVYGFENNWARIDYEDKKGYLAGNYLQQGKIELPSTKTYTLIRDLWVRDKPNGNVINTGTIYGTLDAYEQVEVFEFENGWAKIKFPYYPAYVFAAYLQEGIVSPPAGYTSQTEYNNPSPSGTSSVSLGGTGGGNFFPENQQTDYLYVININTGTIHQSNCGNINNIDTDNRWYSNEDINVLISKGYHRCGSEKWDN